MTTTNLTYTMDYSSKTNPPVVALTWPTNGVQIAATNFTLRGAVEDPTVTLSAQIVDTSGDTNVVSAIVERNGNFWADGLPLASGTNQLTLTAVDAVGNVGVTNISVVQSTVHMAFTPLPDVSNQILITVEGTIDTSGYTVWVNGVQATQSGSAPSISWEAANVPVNGLGTTVFEALAITNMDHGGYGVGGGGGTSSTLSNPGNPTPALAGSPRLTADPDKKSCIICQTYSAAMNYLWTDAGGDIGDAFNNVNFAYGSSGTSLYTSYANWDSSGNGWDGDPGGLIGFGALVAGWDQYGYGDYTNYAAATEDDYADGSDADAYGVIVTMSDPTFLCWDPPFGSLAAQGEESDYAITTSGWDSSDFIYDDYYPTPAILTTQRGVASMYTLQTGGKAASQRQAVFGLSATAENWINLGSDPTPVDAAYSQITVMGLTLDSNYTAYIVEPDGIAVPLPVDVGSSSSTPSAVRAATLTYRPPSFTYVINQSKYKSSFIAYVDMPGPPPSHVTHVGYDYGHAWWMFSSEVPAAGFQAVLGFPPVGIECLGVQVGYADHGHAVGPGVFRFPETDQNISTAKQYYIGFLGLLSGLAYTEGVRNHPGKYNVLFNNCVQHDIAAGAAAGLSLPKDTEPETFGWDLINSK